MTRLKRACWMVVLFAVPYGFILWVPLYNRIEPSWFGIPFFYWFQFLWIIVTAIITAAAYFSKV
jgi:hypothetical protein